MGDEAEARLIKIKGSHGGTFEAEWDGQTSKCRGKTCGAEIGFAKTQRGSMIPISAEDGEIDDDGTEVFVAHFADCPDSKDFKR